LAERNLDFRVADNAGGRVFYIMHPVLRHVAILGGGTGRRAEGPECA
jgi:spermidine synthase